jgi:hypothetical protein
MRIEMPSTMMMLMMRFSSTKWRVTKSLEQFVCKVVKQSDKFLGKVIVTPSPPDWCYNQWIFLVLVFCIFWFDKNLEKWFSVSCKNEFSPSKKILYKKKLKKEKTGCNKYCDNKKVSISSSTCEQRWWWWWWWEIVLLERRRRRSSTGKGAFTLGVKDSSIKSPNTELIK